MLRSIVPTLFLLVHFPHERVEAVVRIGQRPVRRFLDSVMHQGGIRGFQANASRRGRP